MSENRNGSGEYEPRDSRKVTGTVGDPTKSWREQETPDGSGGEYEPRDQRNVTGQPTPVKERWSSPSGAPPRADGQTPEDGAKDGQAGPP